jgi:hypothetical protein
MLKFYLDIVSDLKGFFNQKCNICIIKKSFTTFVGIQNKWIESIFVFTNFDGNGKVKLNLSKLHSNIYAHLLNKICRRVLFLVFYFILFI